MNKKIILLVVLLAVVGGGIYAWAQYDRKVASTADLDARESVTAEELLSAFTADEQQATERFVGTTEQVIEVSGTVRSMEPVSADVTNVTLETGNELAGVVCEFANTDLHPDWRSGATVKVKGICTGVLLDVVLVRCTAAE
ncbi:MAG: hypothetical protein JNM62_10305 [Flavobacteriales bacterium]|nr:hypothetical protein [Flavobacteriales bacterium]